MEQQFLFKDVKTAAEEFFDRVWMQLHPNPRTAPMQEVLLSTYRFWVDCDQQEAKHLNLCMPHQHRIILLRFKLGGHNLQIEKGRFQRQKRHERLCQCCLLGQVEDVKHFLLECQAFQGIRQEFACILNAIDGCMNLIFDYTDTWKVCLLLEKMEAYRSQLLQLKRNKQN